jgi:hypothetical protein
VVVVVIHGVDRRLTVLEWERTEGPGVRDPAVLALLEGTLYPSSYPTVKGAVLTVRLAVVDLESRRRLWRRRCGGRDGTSIGCTTQGGHHHHPPIPPMERAGMQMRRQERQETQEMRDVTYPSRAR